MALVNPWLKLNLVMQPLPNRFGSDARRRNHRRGAELLEFTLTLLPLMALLTVTGDVAWSIFVKSCLQRAVRVGVREGVTLTGSQIAAGACLTDTVKGIVQQNSIGLLTGSSGLDKIKVRYFQPPLPTSSSDAVDVSNQTNGNTPGNIMQVSVEGYTLLALMPRIFSWREAPDSSSVTVNAVSADKIEPSRNPPCIGTAP